MKESQSVLIIDDDPSRRGLVSTLLKSSSDTWSIHVPPASGGLVGVLRLIDSHFVGQPKDPKTVLPIFDIVIIDRDLSQWGETVAGAAAANQKVRITCELMESKGIRTPFGGDVIIYYLKNYAHCNAALVVAEMTSAHNRRHVGVTPTRRLEPPHFRLRPYIIGLSASDFRSEGLLTPDYVADSPRDAVDHLNTHSREDRNYRIVYNDNEL